MAEGCVTDSLTNEAVIRTMSLQKGQEISSGGEELAFSDVKLALDHSALYQPKQILKLILVQFQTFCKPKSFMDFVEFTI